jgi:hypothetical protein
MSRAPAMASISHVIVVRPPTGVCMQRSVKHMATQIGLPTRCPARSSTRSPPQTKAIMLATSAFTGFTRVALLAALNPCPNCPFYDLLVARGRSSASGMRAVSGLRCSKDRRVLMGNLRGEQTSELGITRAAQDAYACESLSGTIG